MRLAEPGRAAGWARVGPSLSAAARSDGAQQGPAIQIDELYA
jgi:hypothetical protein